MKSKCQGVCRAVALLMMFFWFAPEIGAHSAPEQAVTFHGGVAKTTELFNLELVIEDRRLRLFVRDRHNRPLDTGGSSVKALAWGRGHSAEIGLRPGEHATLVGEGEFQTFALERVIVTLRMQEHEPVTAWFSGLSSKGS